MGALLKIGTGLMILGAVVFGFYLSGASSGDFTAPSVVALIAIGIGLYLLPAIVGEVRRHRHHNSITIINLFLGWTLVGWVAALAWAFSDQTKSR